MSENMGGLKLYKSYSLPTQRRNWHYFDSVKCIGGEGGLGVLLQKILGLNGVKLCNLDKINLKMALLKARDGRLNLWWLEKGKSRELCLMPFI